MTPESSSPPSASCSRFRRQRFYPSQPRRWRAPRRALPAMSPTSAAGLAFPLRWRTLRVTEHMRRSKIGRVDSRRLQPSLQQLEAYLTRLIAEQRFQKNENSRAAFVPPMKHLWVRTRGIRRATRVLRVKQPPRNKVIIQFFTTHPAVASSGNIGVCRKNTRLRRQRYDEKL